MSLLGSNMANGVRSELCRRAKIIPNGYGPWTHARIPWARFSPCVHHGDTDSEALRKSHIIFGGNLDNLERSYKTNESTRMGPYSNNYMDIKDGQSAGSNRNNPRPGLTSVKVEEKGTLGGIKKVTINLTIWDKTTLNSMQYSLFALGKHGLIEYGWNIDTTGDLVTTNLGKSLTDVSKTDSEFLCKVRTKQSAHNFCYDAIRGIISNFNWSINDNGGFDCTVELTSKGTTFLSTPTETATMHSGCDEDPDEEDSEQDKVHRPNMEQPLYFLRQKLRVTHQSSEAVRNSNGAPIGMAALFDKELSAIEWIGSFFGEPSNEELDFYVSWDYFEEYVVNRKLAPLYSAIVEKTAAASNAEKETSTTNPGVDNCSGNSSSNPQMFKPAYDAAKPGMDEHPRSNSAVYALDSRGTVVRNSPFLISADPSKVLLPRQEHWVLHPSSITTIGKFGAFIKGVVAYAGEYVKARIGSISMSNLTGNHSKAKKKAEKAQDEAKDEALDKAAREANVNGSTAETLNDFKPFDNKYESQSLGNGAGSSGEGLLSNVLLNVSFIEEVCNEAKSLDDFMDKILEGTQAACGDIWDLVLVEDPDNPQVVRVIDRNMVKQSKKVKGFHFPGIGRKSICRNIDMQTDIDSKMAAMMMYGSNKSQQTNTGQPMGGASSNEYRLFNHKTKDLVMDGIVLPDSKAQTVGVDCCADTIATDINALRDAWTGYYKSASEIADEVNEDSIEGMVTAMRKLLNMASPDQALPAEESPDVGVIPYTAGDEIITVPLKVSLVIDGLSGLRWGNYIGFTSDTEIPNRYTSGKHGASFQIVGIDHEITTGDWTTSIRTVMRPGSCDGKGINNCGSNQGNLPSEIMPTTETVIFDLIPLIPPTTKNDRKTEDDEFELIKLPMLGMEPLIIETNMDIQKANCPCEDGSYHQDCCDQPVSSDDDDDTTIISNVVIDTDKLPKKGCQCENGEFSPECCEEDKPPENTDVDPAACEDPDPIPEPGKIEIVEQKTGTPPDIVIEDTVIEEDCDDWPKRGSVISSGNIKYKSGPFFEDVWYYEFRAHPEHCYFIELFLWHGFDGSGTHGKSKPTFQSMRPYSSQTLSNLFGLTNNFSASTLNRTATADDAAAMIVSSRPRNDIKKVKKKLKQGKYGSYGSYGYNQNTRNEEGLKPGSRFSSGLWISQMISWFRDDQPFEVNKPANEGDGGPSEFSKWSKRDGKGSSRLSYVVPKQGDNESVGSLMKALLYTLAHRSHSPIRMQVRKNYDSFAKGQNFSGGRYYGGTRAMGRDSSTRFNKDLMTGDGWASKGFGWNQGMTHEMFLSGVAENDEGEIAYGPRGHVTFNLSSLEHRDTIVDDLGNKSEMGDGNGGNF